MRTRLLPPGVLPAWGGLLFAGVLLAWGGLLPAAVAADIVPPPSPAPATTYCCYTTAPTTPAYSTAYSSRPSAPQPPPPPPGRTPSRGAATTPGVGRRAVLILDPSRGNAGSSLTVTGSGFAVCAAGNLADLAWDGAGIAPFRVAVAANGGFAVRLTVPERAATGSHSLHAQCGQKAYADASFDVTGSAPSTAVSASASAPAAHTGTGTTTGWVIGGVGAAGFLAAALVAYLGFFRFRRGPRWARGHVRAALRPGYASDGVQDVADPSAPSRTVRLEPRPDPGDHTIEETDR
jgi:hypothetical protein